MSNSKNHFSDIYVEKPALTHPRTERILRFFHDANVKTIDCYKDIFYDSKKHDRSKRSLILCASSDTRVFPGAPVCQNFDERFFYYASSAKNCLYNCEYCYLKGMYPTSHLVIDVDLESVFEDIKNLLDKNPVYLCISYDTDLMALESVIGYVREWMEFASKEDKLLIECRTKCARTDLWDNLVPDDSFIFAFSISPQEIIEAHEHGTPSLNARLGSIRRAIASGHPVRLCFDPMIYIRNWESCYEKMLEAVIETIDLNKVRDISIGSFRISSAYLKRMRKMMPESAVVQFPFDLTNGVYQYPEYIKDEMQSFLYNKLSKNYPAERIYEI